MVGLLQTQALLVGRSPANCSSKTAQAVRLVQLVVTARMDRPAWAAKVAGSAQAVAVAVLVVALLTVSEVVGVMVVLVRAVEVVGLAQLLLVVPEAMVAQVLL